MTQEALKLALEALKNNKLTHLYCEDTWYSCPKHEDGCANEAEGDECNCGADDVNAQFDQAIIALEEALAQPEQEPVATVESVATVVSESGNKEITMSWWHEPALPVGTKLYTTSPQRKPLTDEEIDILAFDEGGLPNSHLEFARAIEAAHGIKE